MSWADQPRSFSDCIAILNAYKVGLCMAFYVCLDDTTVCKYTYTYAVHVFIHMYICIEHYVLWSGYCNSYGHCQ